MEEPSLADTAEMELAVPGVTVCAAQPHGGCLMDPPTMNWVVGKPHGFHPCQKCNHIMHGICGAAASGEADDEGKRICGGSQCRL